MTRKNFVLFLAVTLFALSASGLSASVCPIDYPGDMCDLPAVKQPVKKSYFIHPLPTLPRRTANLELDDCRLIYDCKPSDVVIAEISPDPTVVTGDGTVYLEDGDIIPSMTLDEMIALGEDSHGEEPTASDDDVLPLELEKEEESGESAGKEEGGEEDPAANPHLTLISSWDFSRVLGWAPVPARFGKIPEGMAYIIASSGAPGSMAAIVVDSSGTRIALAKATPVAAEEVDEVVTPDSLVPMAYWDFSWVMGWAPMKFGNIPEGMFFINGADAADSEGHRVAIGVDPNGTRVVLVKTGLPLPPRPMN